MVYETFPNFCFHRKEYGHHPFIYKKLAEKERGMNDNVVHDEDIARAGGMETLAPLAQVDAATPESTKLAVLEAAPPEPPAAFVEAASLEQGAATPAVLVAATPIAAAPLAATPDLKTKKVIDTHQASAYET
ncbi:unnamed protein product [Cuscuta europaea]|uniref:Uncharacterized protein n=1 Tax=Cuscuta europaea TaxID=41803 RepID=A0A9P0YZ39_CUSEU|nr:unnamed protein product [Cuscuta europaea]